MPVICLYLYDVPSFTATLRTQIFAFKTRIETSCNDIVACIAESDFYSQSELVKLWIENLYTVQSNGAI